MPMPMLMTVLAPAPMSMPMHMAMLMELSLTNSYQFNFLSFCCLAWHLIPQVSAEYEAVRAEWRSEILAMTDPKKTKWEVWSSFDKMMYSWLIHDGHMMGWDRVTIVSRTKFLAKYC